MYIHILTCRAEARILLFGGGELEPGHGERGSASLYRGLGGAPSGVQETEPFVGESGEGAN